MKSWWQFLPVVLLVVIALVLARQWQVGVELQGEVAKARASEAELAKLRLENQRLTASRVSSEELENLRADHAAIARLRDELNALKERERATPGSGQ